MINFSGIPAKSLPGRFLRKLIGWVPDDTALYILQGPMRGRRWIKGAGVSGYWLGTYELEHQKILSGLLREGDVFYDVGAHAGFFSLLASHLVGSSGAVYAFEPLPRNATFLKKHIELNRISNIKLIEAAIADYDGEALFEESESSSMGKVSANGKSRVSVTSLDSLVAGGAISPPSVMKIDVEGLQDIVLKGAGGILEKYHPSVLIEAVYEKDNKQNFYSVLTALGYIIEPIGNKSIEIAGDFFAYKK